jgi:hypothetical protein
MADIDELQRKLKSFAEVVNSFKSEAVQLRVFEMLIGEMELSTASTSEELVKSKPSRKRQRKSTAAHASDGATGKVSRKSSRASGAPGPYTMLGELLREGYFKQAKTIRAVIAHSGTARGHHYKPNELSPALLRYLRDQKLERKKNKDGQYEYTQT